MLRADRYQDGAKPAWILEIEEARATSTGAIGQSEAWAANSRQQQQQQEQDEEENHREDEQQREEQGEEMEEIERDEDERQKDEIEERAVEEEGEEEEKKNKEEEDVVLVGEDEWTSAVLEHLSNEPATSQQQQQQPADDVMHDLCDVSSATSSQPEHVIESREKAARVVEDEMTSSGVRADVTEAPVGELRERSERDERATDEVRVGQQPAPAPSHVVCTSTPSPADTDTVARQQQQQQQTVAVRSSRSPTVEERGKRRHKDDKSRRTDHSAEVGRS